MQKVLFLLVTGVAVVLLATTRVSISLPLATPPRIQGLDHIPVAVADLDAAATQYRRLGFTLKPGAPHANGIRNQHAKFADGTEIELITVGAPADALTQHYQSHLRQGDGPVFAAFYLPQLQALSALLAERGQAHEADARFVSLPLSDPLGYLFFGLRNQSPTDRPDHFRHANGADGLTALWLASDDLNSEKRWLATLGARMVNEEVWAPQAQRATVARLPEGQVLLLPGSAQRVPGRKVVGATLRTRDLAALQQVLASQGIELPPVVAHADGSHSMFLSPELTRGLWLEFRERP